jgi:hypothetical protein
MTIGDPQPLPMQVELSMSPFDFRYMSPIRNWNWVGIYTREDLE